MNHVMEYLARLPRPLYTMRDDFDNMNKIMSLQWEKLPDTGLFSAAMMIADRLRVQVKRNDEPSSVYSGAMASYYIKERTIVLRNSLTRGQASHTLLHELGHVFRHDRGLLANMLTNYDREEMIVEAAVSVIETELFGVATPVSTEASALYIAAYALEDELKTRYCYLDNDRYTSSVYKLVEAFIDAGLVQESFRPWYVSARASS